THHCPRGRRRQRLRRPEHDATPHWDWERDGRGPNHDPLAERRRRADHGAHQPTDGGPRARGDHEPMIRTVIATAALVLALAGMAGSQQAPTAASAPPDDDALWRHRNLGKAFYENPTTQAQ